MNGLVVIDRVSETQNAWVIRVLGVDPSAFPAPAQATPSAAADVPASAAKAVTYAKGRLAWLAMRKRADIEVEAFIGSVAEQYEDEGNDEVVRDLLRARLGTVMGTFDDTLADTLDAAVTETVSAKRQALVTQARSTIERYQAYVAGDDLLAAMDDNPFAQTAIQKTMVATLQTLSIALR